MISLIRAPTRRPDCSSLGDDSPRSRQGRLVIAAILTAIVAVVAILLIV